MKNKIVWITVAFLFIVVILLYVGKQKHLLVSDTSEKTEQVSEKSTDNEKDTSIYDEDESGFGKSVPIEKVPVYRDDEILLLDGIEYSGFHFEYLPELEDDELKFIKGEFNIYNPNDYDMDVWTINTDIIPDYDVMDYSFSAGRVFKNDEEIEGHDTTIHLKGHETAKVSILYGSVFDEKFSEFVNKFDSIKWMYWPTGGIGYYENAVFVDITEQLREWVRNNDEK